VETGSLVVSKVHVNQRDGKSMLRKLLHDLTVELETWHENDWHPCAVCGHSTPSTVERAVKPLAPSWVMRLRIRLFDARRDWNCRICMNRDAIEKARRGLEKLQEDPDTHAAMAADRSGI
jgi:hypothetical protein